MNDVTVIPRYTESFTTFIMSHASVTFFNFCQFLFVISVFFNIAFVFPTFISSIFHQILCAPVCALRFFPQMWYCPTICFIFNFWSILMIVAFYNTIVKSTRGSPSLCLTAFCDSNLVLTRHFFIYFLVIDSWKLL